MTAASGADQPTLRDQLAEAALGYISDHVEAGYIADVLLPVIEADRERAKAEAAAEALEGWARAFGIAESFGARRWRFVHAAAARALADDAAERRAALRGSTGAGQ